MALRRIEGGRERNEFNIKAAKNTSFEEQTLCAIGSIKANEKRWQRYILGQSYMDFPAFFAYIGGPYGTGWHEKLDLDWVHQLRTLIEEVQQEFESEENNESP